MTEQDNLKVLIEQAQNGDETAFGELYEVYSNRLYAFIFSKTTHKQTAEDLLQEVLVKIWKALPNYQDKQVQFSSWLYAIANNHIKDHYRSTARRPQTTELIENIDKTSNIDLEETVNKQYVANKLVCLLDGLPDNYRQVVECRFINDLSVAETAHITQKTQLSVRVMQTRAIYKLKKLMSKEDSNLYE